MRKGAVKREAKRAAGPPLTEIQVGYGAKYLACSNMGEPTPKGGFKDLNDLIMWCRRVEQNHAIEGCPLGDEIAAWRKWLEKMDDYSVTLVRRELPFLFKKEVAS